MTGPTLCDERTLRGIEQSLRKVALGKPVQVNVEAGVHRYVDAGVLCAAMNHGISFRVDVCGGSVDTGIPWPRQRWRRAAKRVAAWLEKVSDVR